MSANDSFRCIWAGAPVAATTCRNGPTTGGRHRVIFNGENSIIRDGSRKIGCPQGPDSGAEAHWPIQEPRSSVRHPLSVPTLQGAPSGVLGWRCGFAKGGAEHEVRLRY